MTWPFTEVLAPSELLFQRIFIVHFIGSAEQAPQNIAEFGIGLKIGVTRFAVLRSQLKEITVLGAAVVIFYDKVRLSDIQY